MEREGSRPRVFHLPEFASHSIISLIRESVPLVSLRGSFLVVPFALNNDTYSWVFVNTETLICPTLSIIEQARNG